MFDPDVLIIRGNHVVTYNANHLRFHSSYNPLCKSIKFRDGVWMFVCAMLILGPAIDDVTFIPSGSVIYGSIPQYSVTAGVPAKIAKVTFDTQEDLQPMLKIRNFKPLDKQSWDQINSDKNDLL